MSGSSLTFDHASLAAGGAGADPSPRALVFVPPPLPRRGERDDGLTPAQRHLMVAAILAAHVAGIWGLLQIREVRDAVAEVAPMFVSLVAPEPPKPLPPPPPPVQQPVPKRPPPVVIAAPPTPTPTPAPFIVPPPPAEVPVPVVPPPVAVVAAPAPPAPPPAPKIIPASAVQYLGDPPLPEYPRLSIRAGETGRVMLRIYIDEAGLPRTVQVERSSGHPRLDEAGAAAMKKARFKPYTENGQAVAGWAFVPLDFALEK
ncbi:MAG: energy transducer TonB [Burkholderiales bacterium]|nr:energy transducer TonB [Burkholderiales bacterium]